MPAESIWTEPLVARLRELWAKDYSTAAIGRVMGLTKNQVVAKAHRLRLPGRPSPIRAPAAERAPVPKRPAQPAVPPPIVPPRPAAAPLRRLFGAGPAPSPHRACQWIEGEAAGAASRFCLAPTQPGSSYCPAHHARCHVAREAA